MLTGGYKYPRGRLKLPSGGPLPRARDDEMRIISHAYPQPPPLTMDQSPQQHDSPRVPRPLDVDHPVSRTGSPSQSRRRLLINAASAAPHHAHESGPAPVGYGAAAQRPASDPTTIRALLSTEWRGDRHNGEQHVAAAAAAAVAVARDAQVRRTRRARRVAHRCPSTAVVEQAQTGRVRGGVAEQDSADGARPCRDGLCACYVYDYCCVSACCCCAEVVW